MRKGRASNPKAETDPGQLPHHDRIDAETDHGGWSLPIELQVDIDCDLEDADLNQFLVNAVHASPLNGLMRGKLDSPFTLTKNGATCTLRDDGMKEILQLQYSPHGTSFNFLSEEAPEHGGLGRAPDANSYISAGIGFCFMTQFGVRQEKLAKDRR